MAALHTGIDLVEVERMAELKEGIRQKFLERVFTPTEISNAAGSDVRLAEFFAAKEAVAKALGSGIGPVSWQDIEVRMPVGDSPVLHLSNGAKKIAEQKGLHCWLLSISHTPKYALALVVASS